MYKRQAAGVVAKKILGGATFATRLTAVGGQTDPARFDDAIDDALRDEDSVGGIVECRVAVSYTHLDVYKRQVTFIVAFLLFGVLKPMWA